MTSGGGGVTSGGGASEEVDSAIGNKTGSVAFLGDFVSLVRQVLTPDQWLKASMMQRLLRNMPFFRGVDALMAHRGGAVAHLPQGQRRYMARLDETMIQNPMHLIQLCLRHGCSERDFSTDFPEIFGQYSLVAQQGMGTLNSNRVRRFKAPQAIAETLERHRNLINDTGFQSLRDELGTLLASHSRGSVDLLVVHRDRTLPIEQAHISLSNVQESIHIEVRTQLGAIKFRAAWPMRAADSTVLRFVGTLQIVERGLVRHLPGVLLLESGPQQHHLDARVIWAEQGVQHPFQENGFLTDEFLGMHSIQFRARFIP